MTRWKAAGIHLGISAAVISLVAAGLIALWYGWALFPQMGGARQLGVMAIIDLTIGPLLTLIVFKAGKPSLRFDLTVIAILQAAFLAYGLKVMAESRPVFLVAAADRFDLVFANELDPADLAKGKTPEHRTLSWTGPRIVGGDVQGGSSQERMALLQSALAGKDVQLLPERYVDYEKVAPNLIAREIPATLFAARSGEHGAVVDRFLTSNDVSEGDVAALPIMSRRGSATMMVNAKTGAPLGIIAIDPWDKAQQ